MTLLIDSQFFYFFTHPSITIIVTSVPKIVEHRVVHLSNSTLGRVYHLNFPQTIPQNIDFSQHLIARLGDVISIELHGLRFVNNSTDECIDSNVIEVCIIIFIFFVQIIPEIQTNIILLSHSNKIKILSPLTSPD